MRLVDFLFEVGLLKNTPRSGWLTIGIKDPESVAEHSHRTAVIGYVLAKLEKADEDKVVRMCIFHDLEETRLNDLHTINKKYLKQSRIAYKDIFSGLEFGKELENIMDEFSAHKTKEAVIARDADKLEMVFQAKEYLDEGNTYANDWIKSGMRKLKTKSAKKIAKKVIKSDSKKWIFQFKED